jgi:glutathione S-transferase
MRSLLHFPLHPSSRKIRLLIREKQLDCDFLTERPWDRRDEFLKLNPAGELPVFIDDNRQVVCGDYAISEYLEESQPAVSLLGALPREKAEARRLVQWFDGKFQREVTQNLLHEKLIKRICGQGGPDSTALRAGRANIRIHLDYIGWLVDRRNWLAGDQVSLADLAAAAHLSCIDYLGDVPWDEFPDAKGWYARIKSRPSFRPLLADNLAGTQPAEHYADLDF